MNQHISNLFNHLHLLYAIASTRHHGKPFQSHIWVTSSPHQPKTHLEIPRRCCNPWLHTLKVLKEAPAVTGSSSCHIDLLGIGYYWVILGEWNMIYIYMILDKGKELHLTILSTWDDNYSTPERSIQKHVPPWWLFFMSILWVSFVSPLEAHPVIFLFLQVVILYLFYQHESSCFNRS